MQTDRGRAIEVAFRLVLYVRSIALWFAVCNRGTHAHRHTQTFAHEHKGTWMLGEHVQSRVPWRPINSVVLRAEILVASAAWHAGVRLNAATQKKMKNL